MYRGSPHNVCGILLVKKLIVLSPDDERKISSLGLRYPLPVSPDTPLLELLNLFQRGLSHLALVTDQPELVAECMRTGADIPPDVHMDGIVTLEDILENVRRRARAHAPPWPCPPPLPLTSHAHRADLLPPAAARRSSRRVSRTRRTRASRTGSPPPPRRVRGSTR